MFVSEQSHCSRLINIMQVGPVARSLDICLAVAGCSTMAMQCSGGPMPPSKAKYIPTETFELRDFSHFLSP